ncbi:MAG: NUDIX domain-containing protein [Oscillospiraceae bacterium]|nr:NUDIX domain-containing protein [Oscillospiraceae bacterium]
MSELRDRDGLTEKEFLAAYKEKNYPKPSLTADILIFKKNGDITKLLLIKRGGHPFLGKWALPGGFVNPDESADAAAARELEEETHIKAAGLKQLGLYSKPGRDPRTWVVTEAYIAYISDSAPDADYVAVADDDADAARWFDISCEASEKKTELLLRSDNLKLIIRINGDDVTSEELAFDHSRIIWDGYRQIWERIQTEEPIKNPFI